MRRKVLIGSGIVLALAVIASMAGGGTNSPDTSAAPTAAGVESSEPTAVAPTPGLYEQTWPVPYEDTTCVHWADQMDDHQRFVMAADFLARSRQLDGANELAPEDLQRRFQAALDDICQNEGKDIAMKVAEAAAAVYVMSTDFKP